MTPAELRTTIEALRMSQSAVARCVGIDPRTLRRYLSGALPVPKWVPLALSGMMWKPIETAPKGYRRIFLKPSMLPDGRPVRGFWDPLVEGGCWYHDGVGHLNGLWKPTHWKDDNDSR